MNATTHSSRNCPECGAQLTQESPQSLCPACLMRQAFASRTVIGGHDAGMLPPVPTPEEIAGKFPQFDILECLGRGGMGVVYKARQKSLNRIVAIKVLSPEKGHEARFAERFAREAELLAQLNHPHIVTIHDFGESDGLFYLVMEYVDGVNLRDLLRDGKVEPQQALSIVPPICEALQYAHGKGIVHRDIKPENLLLDREGRIKIADFGIASLIGSSGEISGTPPYMAPEQEDRSKTTDHRADIYALGVVLYEMLTGERPGRHLIAPSRRVSVDVRIDEMVLRALENEPERRYQTAEEFRTIVETLNAPQAVPPPLPPAKSGEISAFLHDCPPTTETRLMEQTQLLPTFSLKPGWICLVIATLSMLLLGPILGSIIASPLLLATLVMAVIGMIKNNVTGGIMLLVLSFIMPPIAFFAGLALAFAMPKSQPSSTDTRIDNVSESSE